MAVTIWGQQSLFDKNIFGTKTDATRRKSIRYQKN